MTGKRENDIIFNMEVTVREGNIWQINIYKNTELILVIMIL